MPWPGRFSEHTDPNGLPFYDIAPPHQFAADQRLRAKDNDLRLMPLTLLHESTTDGRAIAAPSCRRQSGSSGETEVTAAVASIASGRQLEQANGTDTRTMERRLSRRRAHGQFLVMARQQHGLQEDRWKSRRRAFDDDAFANWPMQRSGGKELASRSSRKEVRAEDGHGKAYRCQAEQALAAVEAKAWTIAKSDDLFERSIDER